MCEALRPIQAGRAPASSPNGIGRGAPRLKARLIELGFALVAQSARDGALPLLYAAMAPEAVGGAYYGPSGPGETRGAPGVARIFPQATDADLARRLWNLSEELTGVRFGTVAATSSRHLDQAKHT